MVPAERYSTREAIDALARRFSLRIDPFMQDFEWENSDPARIEEFLGALERETFTDDERFSLTQIIMDSFERRQRSQDAGESVLWQRFVAQLRSRPELNAYVLYYWSAWGSEDLEDAFLISRLVRPLWLEYERSIGCR